MSSLIVGKGGGKSFFPIEAFHSPVPSVTNQMVSLLWVIIKLKKSDLNKLIILFDYQDITYYYGMINYYYHGHIF